MRADIEVFICILLTFSFANGLENINPACQNMWNNAGNNLVVPSELKVDAVNNANPLFEVRSAGAGKVRSPEFQRFKDLMGDYRGVRPAPTQQHIDAFITAVTQPGGPMQAAFDYLRPKGLLPPGVTTLQQFKDVLKNLWFRNSNGFKHVFVGDLNVRANTFTGFHNWYQFLLEQDRNPTQTTNIAFNHPRPFVGNKLPYFLRGLTFTWRGADKVPPRSTSSMFVGTSPAFDLAMFTTCVLKGRVPGGGPTDCVCEIQVPGLGRSTVEFRTVEDSHGKVVTAYPKNVR
ncbi:endoribonuclease endu-1-like [Pocillopora verrucosa]|uniref:endoribonuclease endu-1-like n=1 Tax=Pocillopora verrucosa TaxID=203993 RepID=UPI003340EED4